LETASRNPKDNQNALFYYNLPLKTHYSPQKQTPFLFNKKGLAVAKPIFNFQFNHHNQYPNRAYLFNFRWQNCSLFGGNLQL